MGSREEIDIEVEEDDQPIFAPPTQKTRKTLKVTKGGGPSTQATVSFQDLTVTVSNRASKKVLVNKVSGYVGSGEILMILGSSGCGKSKSDSR